MVPAASELFEVGLHLVRYGHLAHAGDDDHGQTSPNEEHGCSELFHHCACHTNTTPVIQKLRVEVAGAGLLRLVAPPPVVPRLGLDDPRPPIRPPIAIAV